MTATPPAPDPPGPRPSWIPGGLPFSALPRAFQEALSAVLTPLYEELVLAAPTELERAAGLTFVHTTWLEVVGQYELGKELAANLAQGRGPDGVLQELVKRHLRLAETKDRLLKTPLRVKDFYQQFPESVPPPDPLECPGAPPE